MVKEVHPAEAEKLLAMLEGYVGHCAENPDSPMVKIVGLSKVRWQQVVRGQYVPKAATPSLPPWERPTSTHP